MDLLTVVFVLILLAALWWLFRLRRQPTAEDAKSNELKKGTNSQYHSVSIRVGQRACKSAKEMVGRRFLATAAPKLPLPGCELIDCECKFLHHQDRRANRDRRSPFAAGRIGGATGAFESEQREGSDRRRDSDSDPFA